ncbi:hypothetical protein [Aquiflexum sp.]|uniref:hypothetical protein n=1 Tax=Aquiflexum sp. TaxID=1872584 RepID=UPI003593F7CF
MKKIALFLSVMFLFTATAPVAMAKESKNDKKELTVEQEARVAEIQIRVAEIKAMDLSDLSNEERKEVKDELREMKKEAKNLGSGVYISVGAIIIILVLLILLLD